MNKFTIYLVPNIYALKLKNSLPYYSIYAFGRALYDIPVCKECEAKYFMLDIYKLEPTAWKNYPNVRPQCSLYDCHNRALVLVREDFYYD